MKLKAFFPTFVLVFLAIITGFFFAPEDKPERVAAASDPVEEKLAGMSLRDKIGQMIFIGIYGQTVTDETTALLAEYRFGGIIFYDRNLETIEQAKKLSEDLNATAAQSLPLFIAIDEEGGRVARMKKALGTPPSQQSLGSKSVPQDATDWAVEISSRLRKIGVNVNFAPVADICETDSRSFGGDPELVTNYVAAAATGYENANFFYCLKHFPGIGLAKVDPHNDISQIDLTRDELFKRDLLPFRRVIDEHDHSNFMVMVSHLEYPKIERGVPASLSPKMMTDLLRKDLGFDGVIITDDLNMGATKKHDTTENIAIRTIKAGADIALVCHDVEGQKKIFEVLFDAVNGGAISEERINESVRRIIKMKLKLQNRPAE